MNEAQRNSGARFNAFGIADGQVNSEPFSSSSELFIDNVVYARVPEPTSLALLGLGLAGMNFARRKKA